jgi:hypothetical protein
MHKHNTNVVLNNFPWLKNITFLTESLQAFLLIHLTQIMPLKMLLILIWQNTKLMKVNLCLVRLFILFAEIILFPFSHEYFRQKFQLILVFCYNTNIVVIYILLQNKDVFSSVIYSKFFNLICSSPSSMQVHPLVFYFLFFFD